MPKLFADIESYGRTTQYQMYPQEVQKIPNVTEINWNRIGITIRFNQPVTNTGPARNEIFIRPGSPKIVEIPPYHYTFTAVDVRK